MAAEAIDRSRRDEVVAVRRAAETGTCVIPHETLGVSTSQATRVDPGVVIKPSEDRVGTGRQQDGGRQRGRTKMRSRLTAWRRGKQIAAVLATKFRTAFDLTLLEPLRCTSSRMRDGMRGSATATASAVGQPRTAAIRPAQVLNAVRVIPGCLGPRVHPLAVRTPTHAEQLDLDPIPSSTMVPVWGRPDRGNRDMPRTTPPQRPKLYARRRPRASGPALAPDERSVGRCARQRWSREQGIGHDEFVPLSLHQRGIEGGQDAASVEPLGSHAENLPLVRSRQNARGGGAASDEPVQTHRSSRRTTEDTGADFEALIAHRARWLFRARDENLPCPSALPMPPAGFEPATLGLKVRCSAN
jgi:hypothetical protein